MINDLSDESSFSIDIKSNTEKFKENDFNFV